MFYPGPRLEPTPSSRMRRWRRKANPTASQRGSRCAFSGEARESRSRLDGSPQLWVYALGAAFRYVTGHVAKLTTVVARGTFLRRLRRLQGVATVIAFPVRCRCRVFFFGHRFLPIVCLCPSCGPRARRTSSLIESGNRLRLIISEMVDFALPNTCMGITPLFSHPAESLSFFYRLETLTLEVFD